MASKSERNKVVQVGCSLLPRHIVKLLVGSILRWEDKNPLSNDAEEKLHFYFDTKTNKAADVLLRKHGLGDVSHVVNLKGFWQITMTLVFRCPNHPGHDRHECYPFRLHGTIFPMTGKFAQERDRFYLAEMMHNNEIPRDKKSFGIYHKTLFEAQLIGV